MLINVLWVLGIMGHLNIISNILVAAFAPNAPRTKLRSLLFIAATFFAILFWTL